MNDIQSNFDIPLDECRTILLIADRAISLLGPEVEVIFKHTLDKERFWLTTALGV